MNLSLEKKNYYYNDAACEKLLNLGVSLPEQYIAFLKDTDGGVVDKRNKKIHIKSLGDDFEIECLFPIEKILDNYARPLDSDIPDNLLPFGINAFGELLCIKVKGESLGSIYMFNPLDGVGDAIEGELSSYENIFFVCNSLDEMCSSLKESEY